VDPNTAAPPVPLDKKSGTQQWSTFETHAQRVDGKTHEESMAEIDRFIDNASSSSSGVTVQKVDGPALMSELGRSLQRNNIKVQGAQNSYVIEAPARGGEGGAAAGKTVTEITETTFSVDGVKKDGPIAADNVKGFANPGVSSADQFLQQHQQNEAAKFKPGYANRNPNGVR
jgi:hypothetical protein